MVYLNHLGWTESLCPECLKKIPAELYEENGRVMYRKKCPKHGEVEDVYWGSYELYVKASRFAHDGKLVENPNVDVKEPTCPFDCGLCRIHLNHTALGNIVLTNRCDLACWYCFFYAEKAGFVYEPSLQQIRAMFKALRNVKPVPCNAVQLTGGEPTLRDDLVEIVKMAKEEGIDHVQLNTDGIKLALDRDLALRVREAGVNTVYLSFDGVTEKTNPKNHFEIPLALNNCRRAGLGVVLVPTVINTVNDHEVGAIVRFASDNIDVVRGVNYQPVSLVGRVGKAERNRLRITIPDVIARIEEQLNGEISREDFYPVPCVSSITHFVEALTKKPQYELSVHFACGMATYVVKDGLKLIPVTRFIDVEGLFQYLEEKTRELEAGRSRTLTGLDLLFKINRFIDRSKAPRGLKLSRILYNAFIKHDYAALAQFHYKTLFIGMMHFQDLYNYDVNRVRRCDIHYAVPDGRIIPFCAFNVLPQLYRDRIQREYGEPIKRWEKRVGRKLSDDLYRRDLKKLKELEADLAEKAAAKP